jgi:AcrR family transcriptional regulator
MEKQSCPTVREDVDHRILSARVKRESTRRRILEATVRVFARMVDDAPVIEDVVREAGIARGTFYKYFDSLDQAMAAAGNEANDRMIADIQSVYDILKEPWQRVSVGFRAYMVRALQDPVWATVITRIDAWSHNLTITRHMAEDFRQGRKSGQFEINDIDVTVDFIKGASLSGVHAVSRGVPNPVAYMDESVGLALYALGCTAPLRERAIAFSREHLDGWVTHGRARWTPL